jgi:MFS family permease
MSDNVDDNWIRSIVPFIVMCFGGFMALLDIQIVASSLQNIGGGLSAAQDEISWVQTAYLIAEIIVIPLSGWLTRVFSTCWLFTASAAGFTATSMLCGVAWDIHSMILFRALQGGLGASMIPIVFTSSLHYFQGPRRVYSAAVVGTIASVAPTLGPIIGGWITDTLNWHWLFYVNLAPGIAITLLVPFLVNIDKPDLRLLKDADYPGIVLMAIGLGTLEYVLEEGTRWNWFDDSTIRACAYIAGVSGVLFVWRSLTFPRPVVDLRKFRRWMLFVLCHRRWNLFHDLPHAIVSRLCPRFFRLADRARDLFDRRSIADRRSDLHRSCQEVRHPLADDAGTGVVRLRHVELYLYHSRLGGRSTLDPANPSRTAAGLCGRAGCQSRARQPAAGSAQICQRAVQHDAQSRRRGRHRPVRRNHQCQDKLPFRCDRVQPHADQRRNDAIPR